MSAPIEITLSDALYKRAEQLARQQRRNIPDALTTLLEHTLPPLEQVSAAVIDEEVEREREAYLRLHPQLLAQYANEYVAIYGGELVDHDADKHALFQRIDEHYPDKFVLMRQVQQQADPEYRFVSARLEP